MISKAYSEAEVQMSEEDRKRYESIIGKIKGLQSERSQEKEDAEAARKL